MSTVSRSSLLPSLRNGSRLALVPLLAAACGVEVPAGSELAPVDSRPVAQAPVAQAPAAAPAGASALRLHTEPRTGVRFRVPRAGVTVEERHFDPSLPASKFRHSIRVKVEGGTRVVVDVWDNPAGTPLDAWFQEHLSFLVRDTTQVSQRAMTSSHLRGILLREPASEQASSQAIAVFAFRDQVFRVTGIAVEEDAATQELFDRVVDQIELGVAR